MVLSVASSSWIAKSNSRIYDKRCWSISSEISSVRLARVAFNKVRVAVVSPYLDLHIWIFTFYNFGCGSSFPMVYVLHLAVLYAIFKKSVKLYNLQTKLYKSRCLSFIKFKFCCKELRNFLDVCTHNEVSKFRLNLLGLIQ